MKIKIYQESLMQSSAASVRKRGVSKRCNCVPRLGCRAPSCVAAESERDAGVDKNVLPATLPYSTVPGTVHVFYIRSFHIFNTYLCMYLVK